MPTVPRPVLHIFPSPTEQSEPNLDDDDRRFGFDLPPRVWGALVPPQVASPSSAPSDPSVTRGVSPIAPATEADSSRVPIDPILLAESQLQLSCRPPPVVYHSLSSQARQALPALLGRNSLAAKGQATDADVNTSDAGGSKSGNSDDESEALEPARSTHSNEYVRSSVPVNAHRN